jgi:hypothetical protein
MPTQSPTDRLTKLFHRRKCWTLAELAQELDYAPISVRRFLNQIGYSRSYTHNGKWYTLRDSPQFDPEGLWHYRGIGFSKLGSLTATITHLVSRSPIGLSARELAQKLQHPCRAVVTIMHQDAQLDRIKLRGGFRYLSTAQPTNHRQRAQAVVEQAPSSATALSTQTAVLVLVEHIKNPGLSFEQIAKNVQKQRAITVAAESIRRFFEDHGLKKTLEISIAKS